MENNLSYCGVRDITEVIKANSADAYDRFPNNHFDFIFIDATHSYKAVIEDITIWYPKLKIGGTICGHDFGGGHHGVIKAVSEKFPNFKLGPRTGSIVWYYKKLEEKKDV